MERGKHTPGPWVYAESGPSLRYVVFPAPEVGAPGEAVCMTYGQPCQEADARLIAEAPAMVEALRKVAGNPMAAPWLASDGTAQEIRAILVRLDAESTR